MLRSRIIATRYNEERVLRSHFISGNIKNSGVDTSTFSCSEYPPRIFSTLEDNKSLGDMMGDRNTILFLKRERLRYTALQLFDRVPASRGQLVVVVSYTVK